ncbi:MAG: glyoxalase [Flavobacteriaceae bacterium]
MDKKSIRPEILNISRLKGMSEFERFQNKTVRPIIKMQHPIIIAFFKTYLKGKRGDVFYSQNKLSTHINTSLSKDISFKNKMIGIIIGQFTIEEFEFYTQESSEINKRIVSIVKQRLSDSASELI